MSSAREVGGESLPLRLDLVGHSDVVSDVCVWDERTLISTSWDGSARVWSTSNGRCLSRALLHSTPQAVVLLPSGEVAIACGDHAIHLFAKNEEGGLLPGRTLTGHTSGIFSLAVFEDVEGNTILASGARDGVLRVWDVMKGECIGEFKGHADTICALQFMPPARLVSASADCTLRVWDLSTGMVAKTLAGHAAPVLSVRRLSTSLIASGCEDGGIRVWNVDTHKCMRALVGHRGAVWDMLPLDGTRMLSASADATLRVWDYATGACTQVLRNVHGPARSMCVRPEGDLVVANGEDSSVSVYELHADYKRWSDSMQSVILASSLPASRYAFAQFDNLPMLLSDALAAEAEEAASTARPTAARAAAVSTSSEPPIVVLREHADVASDGAAQRSTRTRIRNVSALGAADAPDDTAVIQFEEEEAEVVVVHTPLTL